jgi:hypothetical protein
MRNEDLFRRMQEQYGKEYAEFFRTEFGSSSNLCPYCKTATLRKLWIGDPAREVDGKIWAKWYKWCESCLRGIYCPLGTYYMPENEPYIPWGNEIALKSALPAGLQLIKPTRSTPESP